MASLDSDAPSAVQIQIYFYYTLGSIVVLYYDYALTLSMEVERIWLRPLTIASFFFYLNRYLTLLGHIPIFFQIFFSSDDPVRKANICHPLAIFRQYFAVAIQAIVLFMFIMRTYALYLRSMRILVSLIVTAVALLTMSGVAVFTLKDNFRLPDAAPRLGCTDPLTSEQGLHIAIAWVAVVVYDSIIFGLTFYKTLDVFRAGRHSLVTIFFRDGAVYFAILVIVNLSNIFTFFVRVFTSKFLPPSPADTHTHKLAPPLLRGVCAPFSTVLAAIMVSRMMLNLRDPKLGDRRLPRWTLTRISALWPSQH